MPFKPGESGNPQGRPKGSPNKRTLVRKAVESAFDEGEQGFWSAVAAQAKEGDATALQMLANRLAAPYKPSAEPVQFVLPEGDLHQQAQGVLDAIAEGEIPPDLGVNLVTAINSTARTLEIIELEKRIATLEKKHE